MADQVDPAVRALLSGNEAVARGAWEAGVRLGIGYPGTPSTEILETLATLEALVDDYLKGRVDPAELASPDRPDGLDAGLRERLELLGYLEASE